MTPLTVSFITLYKVVESDDRREIPKYFLEEDKAISYANGSGGGGYRRYIGPMKGVKVVDEDDNDSERFMLATEVTMSMGHIDQDELRRNALSKLTAAEREALGLPEFDPHARR